MVTKTKRTARKSAKVAYKVTAIYSAAFNTRSAAESVIAKIKKTSKYAGFSPIKKTAKGYAVTIRFVLVAANAAIRDRAVSGAKAQGARVTVSTIRV